VRRFEIINGIVSQKALLKMGVGVREKDKKRDREKASQKENKREKEKERRILWRELVQQFSCYSSCFFFSSSSFPFYFRLLSFSILFFLLFFIFHFLLPSLPLSPPHLLPYLPHQPLQQPPSLHTSSPHLPRGVASSHGL
jgi:hypothetical protein